MHRGNKTGDKENIQYICLCLFVGTILGLFASLILTKNLVGLCTGTALGLIVGAVIDIYQNKNEQ
ncbi:MAG: hypothetical protein GX187_03015 [Clostridiaceae bacterium]|nr:hypothetical protein [Clostridiaceae bacterium]